MPDTFSDPRFTEVISDPEQILEVIGRPAQRVLDKVNDHIEATAAAFIASSPFLLIGTTDAAGNCDVSPKGDPAGFVKVLDEKTIAIPDRPGNRRIDTFRNILANPRVGLIFLIPGKGDTLRINGAAQIVRDLSVRQMMAVNDKLPDFAIIVHTEEVYLHCTKCMVRSKLWQPDAWPDLALVPTMAEAIRAQANLQMTLDEYQAILDRDVAERLY